MTAPALRTNPPKPIDREVLRRFYRRGIEREHGFEPLVVEGKLPDDLVGTLYRNGPGLAELHGRAYPHPFEADGAVSAVRFGGGGSALGAIRVTQSAGLKEERAAGKILYGSNAPWPRRVINSFRGKMKNTANTSVMFHQDKLYALMEAAKPTEIDPSNLDTIGESTLGGVVRGAFSAHPHRVASRGETYNFGVSYGRQHAIHIYALPDVGNARRLTTVPVGFPPMLHDFIVTESTILFFFSPVAIKVARVLSGMGGLAEIFEWQPHRGTEIIAVPIDEPEKIRRFTVPAFFQWHFANAFDGDDGRLVVDYVRYENFDSFTGLVTGREFDPGVLHRAHVDFARETIETEAIAETGCEFPRVNPSTEGGVHRFIWVMTEDDRGIMRVDTETGACEEVVLGEGQLTSEPVFVPRGESGDEKDGYALALSFDLVSKKSFVAVLDAARLADGPLAKVWFDHQLPQTFHGVWRGEE